MPSTEATVFVVGADAYLTAISTDGSKAEHVVNEYLCGDCGGVDVVTCDGKRHAGVHGIVAGVEVPCAAETEVGVSRSLFEVCYRGDETVEVYGESALVNSLRLVVAVVDEGSLRGEVVLRDEDRVFIVSVAYNAVSVAAFHHTGKFAGSIYVVLTVVVPSSTKATIPAQLP